MAAGGGPVGVGHIRPGMHLMDRCMGKPLQLLT
jgi:hypothetical protein